MEAEDAEMMQAEGVVPEEETFIGQPTATKTQTTVGRMYTT